VGEAIAQRSVGGVVGQLSFDHAPSVDFADTSPTGGGTARRAVEKPTRNLICNFYSI
jgi:hypothetical protein